jgi:hypothetical protein
MTVLAAQKLSGILITVANFMRYPVNRRVDDIMPVAKEKAGDGQAN